MDVIKTLKPFIKLWQIFGLFPFNLDKSNGFYFLTESRVLLRYSKVLFWVLMLSDGGTIISHSLSSMVGIEISSQLVLFLSGVTLYLSFVMIFLTIVKKGQILCFWLNQFNNLCVSCPLKINSVHLERFNCALILSSTFYFILLALTKYLTIQYETKAVLLADVVFLSRLWVIHLFLKLFVIFANYVRFYYVTVREALKRKKTQNFPRFWVRVMQKLRCEDLFVKSFVEVLHSFYVPVLLVQLIWFFVTTLCDITITSRAGMPTVMQVQWMVYICAETFLYLSVCHYVEKEAQRTIGCIQEQFITLDDSELLYEFELFSLQLQHTPLKFNALGFFNLDFTRLYSMIGATTTYSIILLQFQSDSAAKSHIETFNKSMIVEEIFH